MSYIVQNIEIIVDDYLKETGRKPAGIILGPKEYIALCEFLKQNQRYMKDAKVDSIYVTEYLGTPVYAKDMPGIDLLIPYQDAFKYWGK